MSKKDRLKVTESEEELVTTAQSAVSQCNWVVGECAAKWTQKYAKGRTDANFGTLVGLTGDQIYQRRRVFETFGDVYNNYSSLKWSHFYVGLTWDDAPECLQWAEENGTTVMEMKAWRRMMRGEDLTEETSVDEWGGESAVSFVPSEPTAVRHPDEFGQTPSESFGSRSSSGSESPETVSAAAREAGGPEDAYSPFRKGAGSPPPKEGSSSNVAVVEKPRVAADQLAKRMTATVERINKALSPDVLKDFHKLPEKMRTRFIKAVGELSTKAADLM